MKQYKMVFIFFGIFCWLLFMMDVFHYIRLDKRISQLEKDMMVTIWKNYTDDI